MLILSRRIGESIELTIDGKKAVVTLLGINGAQTRIGISADQDIKVLRSELAIRDRKLKK